MPASAVGIREEQELSTPKEERESDVISRKSHQSDRYGKAMMHALDDIIEMTKQESVNEPAENGAARQKRS